MTKHHVQEDLEEGVITIEMNTYDYTVKLTRTYQRKDAEPLVTSLTIDGLDVGAQFLRDAAQMLANLGDVLDGDFDVDYDQLFWDYSDENSDEDDEEEEGYC